MGIADDDLIAPLLNPFFMGGPRWPAMRQAWRRVRRGQNTIIVTDGLSDPFDDQEEMNVGLGVEILVESNDIIQDPVQGSWLFKLIYDVSQQTADSESFRELRNDLGLFSMELYAEDEFGAALSTEGRVGVLFEMEAPDIPLEWEVPSGLVRIVTAKLLFPSELNLILSKGETGRSQLRELFVADGSHHLSSLNRKPAV
jgi:hypothetical protein